MCVSRIQPSKCDSAIVKPIGEENKLKFSFNYKTYFNEDTHQKANLYQSD